MLSLQTWRNGLLILWISAISASAKDTPVFGKDDPIFGGIEKQQGESPFGKTLDAGTGKYSLRWLSTLTKKGMTDLTAITADKQMRKSVQPLVKTLGIQDITTVVIGNWLDPKGIPPVPLDEKFDTIVADYLIGAMDAFSPYTQDQMIPKLVDHLKPGGKLYIVGMEPIPDSAEGDANIICQVAQVRDACMLLAGQRPYREYPLEWVKRQASLLGGIQLVDSVEYPTRHSGNFIRRQIKNGRRRLPLIKSKKLAKEMEDLLDDLERRSDEATKSGPIELSSNYVVSITKLGEATCDWEQ